MKVFLGGTCNNSTWREELIPMLNCDYFNPVVSDWTPECQEEELKQREECDYLLYVITSEMKGVYSIAEVVDDSNKRPGKVIFCFLRDGFDESQIKSLEAVQSMLLKNRAHICQNLEHVANTLSILNHDSIQEDLYRDTLKQKIQAQKSPCIRDIMEVEFPHVEYQAKEDFDKHITNIQVKRHDPDEIKDAIVSKIPAVFGVEVKKVEDFSLFV